MGRIKKVMTTEPMITRKELIATTGLSEESIRREQKAGMPFYDLGHRTKKYRLSEVNLWIAQKKIAG